MDGTLGHWLDCKSDRDVEAVETEGRSGVDDVRPQPDFSACCGTAGTVRSHVGHEVQSAWTPGARKSTGQSPVSRWALGGHHCHWAIVTTVWHGTGHDRARADQTRLPVRPSSAKSRAGGRAREAGAERWTDGWWQDGKRAPQVPARSVGWHSPCGASARGS